MANIVWDEISYPFLNFIGAVVEIEIGQVFPSHTW